MGKDCEEGMQDNKCKDAAKIAFGGIQNIQDLITLTFSGDTLFIRGKQLFKDIYLSLEQCFRVCF